MENILIGKYVCVLAVVIDGDGGRRATQARSGGGSSLCVFWSCLVLVCCADASDTMIRAI